MINIQKYLAYLTLLLPLAFFPAARGVVLVIDLGTVRSESVASSSSMLLMYWTTFLHLRAQFARCAAALFLPVHYGAYLSSHWQESHPNARGWCGIESVRDKVQYDIT